MYVSSKTSAQNYNISPSSIHVHTTHGPWIAVEYKRVGHPRVRDDVLTRCERNSRSTNGRMAGGVSSTRAGAVKYCVVSSPQAEQEVGFAGTATKYVAAPPVEVLVARVGVPVHSHLHPIAGAHTHLRTKYIVISIGNIKMLICRYASCNLYATLIWYSPWAWSERTTLWLLLCSVRSTSSSSGNERSNGV